jgi:hypothetical protein
MTNVTPFYMMGNFALWYTGNFALPVHLMLLVSLVQECGEKHDFRQQSWLISQHVGGGDYRYLLD